MRRSTLVLAVTVASVVLASCGGESERPSADTPSRYVDAGTFTWAISGDLGSYDPYRTQSAFTYANLAYDSLVDLQPDGTFVSGLAEDWTVDATSASFTLRPDVTCSDGTPLQASHVADVLTFLGNPDSGARLYGVTVPTQPYTVTADDDTRQVQVSMDDEPFGFLLQTVGLTPIVCPQGMADPELIESGSDGTGPYVLTEVTPGQSYTFTVRDGYAWGPGGTSTDEPGTPATIVLRVVPNETTVSNLLLSGEVNFAPITGPDKQRLLAAGLDTLDFPLSGAWLWFNQIGNRPTADSDVRRALVHALDLGEVIKVNTGGNGDASTGIVATGPNPCPRDSDVLGFLPEHDPAAAERLLESAGWSTAPDVQTEDAILRGVRSLMAPRASPNLVGEGAVSALEFARKLSGELVRLRFASRHSLTLDAIGRRPLTSIVAVHGKKA